VVDDQVTLTLGQFQRNLFPDADMLPIVVLGNSIYERSATAPPVWNDPDMLIVGLNGKGRFTIQLSPSCPFRRLHTFSFLWPARNYPRFWIWRPSFGHQRDFNPYEHRAAQRALPAC
jgi:hypothetical protein